MCVQIITIFEKYFFYNKWRTETHEIQENNVYDGTGHIHIWCDQCLASEDDSTIELSQVDADEMMSFEEGKLIGQTGNDELISEGNSGTFAELQGNITAAKPGSTFTLTENYEWESGFDIEGIYIDKSITIDGNGFKINAKEKSRIFKITADNVILKNISFTNGKTTGNGGAVFFEKSGIVTNCNFSNNFNDGGTVFFVGKGEVTNCNFTGNNATTGSAIYFWNNRVTHTVSNSIFLNNRANAEALEIIKNDNNITIIFTGQNNLLNAIYSPDDVTFTNVTYWGANGITTLSASRSVSNKEEGQNITVGVVVNNELVLSDVMVTDENGMIVLDIIAGENYYISARHNTDSYYTEAETTISNNTKFNVNVTSKTTNNRTVNITAKSNIPQDILEGKYQFILSYV